MKEKNDELFWANDLTKKDNKLMNKKDRIKKIILTIVKPHL